MFSEVPGNFLKILESFPVDALKFLEVNQFPSMYSQNHNSGIKRVSSNSSIVLKAFLDILTEIFEVSVTKK